MIETEHSQDLDLRNPTDTNLIEGEVSLPEAIQLDNSESAVTEIRHEAGLSAGNTMQLRQGRYEFGPTQNQSGGLSAGEPATIGFELRVFGPDEIIIVPGDTTIKVDGRPLTKAEPVLRGQSIEAGADHFSLGAKDDFVAIAKRPRPKISVSEVPSLEAKPKTRLLWLFGGLLALGLVLAVLWSTFWIGISIIGAGFGISALIRSSKQYKQLTTDHAVAVTRASDALSLDLSRAQNLTARQCRAAHLSPTDLINQDLTIDLTTDSPTPSRSAAHTSESSRRVRVAIGLGNVGWTPPVTEHTTAGWDYEAIVEAHSNLSGVPFVLDFSAGPIALIGTELATAALSRYVAKAIESSSGHDLTVLNGQDLAARTINLQTSTPEGGLLILLGQESPIPASCHRIITLEETGFATVEDREGNMLTTGLIPNGLPLLENSIALEFERIVISSPLDSVRLFTSGGATESKRALAEIGLDIATSFSTSDVSITIIDSGDRGLIRLRQLPRCYGYAAIDDHESTDLVLAELSEALNQPDEGRHVVLISEFDHLIEHLETSGRPSLSTQLRALAGKAHQPNAIESLRQMRLTAPNDQTALSSDITGLVARFKGH